MPNLSIRIPSDREPLVDPKTGLITRSWFLFFQWIFQRVGGATGDPIDTTEELLAAVDGLLSAPVLAEQEAVESIATDLSSQRELIAELQRQIQSIQSGQVVL